MTSRRLQVVIQEHVGSKFFSGSVTTGSTVPQWTGLSLRRTCSMPIGSADPQDLLRTAAELVDYLEPDRSLQAEALALALARREAATLMSCGQRLLRLAEQVLP